MVYWLMTIHPHVFVLSQQVNFACLLSVRVVLTHSLMPVRCPGGIVDMLQLLKHSTSALESSVILCIQTLQLAGREAKCMSTVLVLFV